MPLVFRTTGYGDTPTPREAVSLIVGCALLLRDVEADGKAATYSSLSDLPERKLEICLCCGWAVARLLLFVVVELAELSAGSWVGAELFGKCGGLFFRLRSLAFECCTCSQERRDSDSQATTWPMPCGRLYLSV